MKTPRMENRDAVFHPWGLYPWEMDDADGGPPVATELRPTLPSVQIGNTALGLLHAGRVGLVRLDQVVQVQRLRAVFQFPIVQTGRPQAGVVLRRRGPLETPLVIRRRPLVLAERPALVNVAEVVRGVADPVALPVIWLKLV